MEILEGYKVFNANMTNRYGDLFQEGRTYQISSSPRFGNQGIGFHFCKRLEDTLRYFPGMEEAIQIAKVTSQGEHVESSDEYYGYYDMYCTNSIRIDKILTREEILSMFLEQPKHQITERVCRFLRGYRLTQEEIELFRMIYSGNEDIQNTISYYQERKLDTYEKAYRKRYNYKN